MTRPITQSLRLLPRIIFYQQLFTIKLGDMEWKGLLDSIALQA